ncbi:MAG: LEA type 2 family protein, partial [Fibrobacterota bacterium]
MKSLLWIFFPVLLFFPVCRLIPDTDPELYSITIKNIKAEGAEGGMLRLKPVAAIENRSKKDLKIDRLLYRVLIDSDTSGTGEIEKKILVSASGAEDITLPITVDGKSVFSGIGRLLTGRGVKIRIETKIHFPVLFFTWPVPLKNSAEREIDAAGLLKLL